MSMKEDEEVCSVDILPGEIRHWGICTVVQLLKLMVCLIRCYMEGRCADRWRP